MLDFSKTASAELRSHSLRILVADDDAFNRRLATALVGRAGHEVRAVDGGRAVLTELELEEFDLVLMDVQMPQMDGIEATQRIRAREKARGGHIPIIALTGMSGDRDRCLAAGMDGYAAKPLDSQTLLAEIDAVVGAKASRASSTRALAARAATAGFDRAEALRQVGGDTALLCELARLFRDNARSMMHEIRKAAGTPDPEATVFAAHKLKGSLLSLAGRAAAEHALTIEESGRRGELPSAHQLDLLEQEVAQLSAELAALEPPQTA